MLREEEELRPDRELTPPLPDDLEFTGSRAVGKTRVLGCKWGKGVVFWEIFHNAVSMLFVSL